MSLHKLDEALVAYHKTRAANAVLADHDTEEFVEKFRKIILESSELSSEFHKDVVELQGQRLSPERELPKLLRIAETFRTELRHKTPSGTSHAWSFALAGIVILAALGVVIYLTVRSPQASIFQ